MNQNKETLIYVNGREVKHMGKMISYIEVIRYAFGEFKDDGRTAYTVTYTDKHENKGGTLVLGDEIKAKKEMIFDATRTNKS